MDGGGSCTMPGALQRARRRVWIALMALGHALLACSEFESSSDTLESVAENAFESDSRPGMNRRRCAVPSGVCSRANEPNAASHANDSVTGSSTAESLPAVAAGTPASVPAAQADAGNATPPNASSSDAGETLLCQGLGEFSGLAGVGCFVWVAELESWDDARNACADWGGRLASVDSEQEDELLAKHMAADSWIGVNDRDVEGELVSADGGVLTFTNWADSQPDNFDASEDCVEKLQRNGLWNDARCDQKNSYFCERP
jgi:hypothetical protein